MVNGSYILHCHQTVRTQLDSHNTYIQKYLVFAFGVHKLLRCIFLLKELGLIRKPASFMTSISDERGQELLYAGMPISAVLEQGM